MRLSLRVRLPIDLSPDQRTAVLEQAKRLFQTHSARLQGSADRESGNNLSYILEVRFDGDIPMTEETWDFIHRGAAYIIQPIAPHKVDKEPITGEVQAIGIEQLV